MELSQLAERMPEREARLRLPLCAAKPDAGVRDSGVAVVSLHTNDGGAPGWIVLSAGKSQPGGNGGGAARGVRMSPRLRLRSCDGVDEAFCFMPNVRNRIY